VRLVRFAGTVALIVLTGRQLAYALVPDPTASALQHAAGGRGLVITTLIALPLGLALACALLWFASLGVRERHLLSGERTAVPRLSGLRVALDAVTFAAAACLVFAALESYIHWRAGLGFHGLRCLTGPAHRNAIPILCSLALLAASLRGALRHVLAWMRRTSALLRARHRALPQAARLHIGAARIALSTLLGDRIRVRGPPRVAVLG
jgi:hypothetical protein